MSPAHFNVPCYVLTIESEGGARRAHASQELHSLGLSAVFVKGFHKSDPWIVSEYSEPLNLLLSKRGLTRGEIAVYCGHRKIWREFLSSGHSHALILEDDFRVSNRAEFAAAIRDGLEQSANWDILKFFDFKPKRVIESLTINSTKLVRYKYAASGAVAYMISRDAAQKLLSRKRFFRAVDEDFSWPWEFGLSIWSVSPNLVMEISDVLGGSLLEKDRRVAKRRRNIARSVWGNVIQAYKLVRSKLYEVELNRRAAHKEVVEIPE